MIPKTSEATPGSKPTPAATSHAAASKATVPTTSCQWSRQGGQYVIEVRGELDLAAVEQHGLTTALNAYRSDEPVDVLLDLGDVTFLDSAGLSWLMSVRSTATLANRRLRVRRTSAAVDKVLEMAGLARYFAPTEAPSRRLDPNQVGQSGDVERPAHGSPR